VPSATPGWPLSAKLAEATETPAIRATSRMPAVRGDPVRGDRVRGDPVRSDSAPGAPVRSDPVRGDPAGGDPF
jgi:hypothetical protein